MKKLILFFSLVLLVFFLLLFSSCEKPVKIDIPRKDPVLVVNGILAKDSTITISVGKSRHILDHVDYSTGWYEQYVVKNATVIIFENNTAIDTLVYQTNDYNYRSLKNKKVRAGYDYTVRVSASGYADVEGVTVVPSQSTIAELKRVKRARVDSYGDPVDDITLKFDDPAEKNYYLVQVFGSRYYGAYGYTVGCVSTTDADVEAIGEYADPLDPNSCFDGGNLLLKDDNFNGTQKIFKFSVNSGVLDDYVDPSSGKIYRPYLKLFRITQDHFKYLKSRSVYENTDGNPFAEPANIYSNIKHGYGIFAAHTVAIDTLR